MSAFNFSWRTVHNDMLIRCSIALENLSRTIPQIDEGQKVAVPHPSFKDTSLFRGELAKLQKGNMERASALTVFPAPAAPFPTYAPKPGRGKPFKRDGYSFIQESWPGQRS